MSQLLNDYRVALLERSRNIQDRKQSMRWHFSQTLQLAEDAILCLYVLLVEAIAQDVALTLPPSQAVTSPTSMEDLRQQCYKLAERLNRAELNLTQQLEVILDLVGCIARLVSLHTEQSKQINTLHRSTSSGGRGVSRRRR